MECAATAKSLDSHGSGAISSRWISANAGSGKTHALVARVLALLLLGVPPERICCITYTRAAAAEMRARVVKELRKLLLAEDVACRAQCAQLLNRPPSAEEFSRARTLFGQLLDSPSGGLELTTIHGFCQRLLRAFPLEAGVAPYFTVLDEAETSLLMHRAGQRLLDDDEDEAVVHALALLAERAPEQRFQTLARSILGDRARWRSLGEDFKERLYALHGIAPGASDASLVDAYCALPSAEDAKTIRAELPRLATHKNQHEKKIALVLDGWLADKAARHRRLPEMLGLWLTKDLSARKKLVNEKDFPAGSPIRTVFEKLTAASIRLVEQRGALACAEESCALATMAQALLAHYEQLKATRSALDYEDLITRTVQLLTTRDMTAWVMSKLDHRIDHIMVDEAQDTSAGQWDIVKALIAELIASSDGVGAAGMPRSLLVVGDEKQSIFSFQGADPNLFAGHQSFFEELLSHSAAPLMPDVLTVSQRSVPAILQAVDAVAALPDIAVSLSAAGATEKHRHARTDAAGEVALYPLLTPEEKTKPEAFVIPRDYAVTRSGAEQVAEAIGDKIEGWLQAGRFTAGDILILVHRRKPMVPALIRALERKHVPVAGIDRLILSEHLAVKDLLALMRWVSFPEDDLALAQVLRSPLIGISEEALTELAYGREANLWQRLRGDRTLEHWLALHALTPYDFLTEVLEVGDARRRFAERFGEEVHEVLDELKEQANLLPLTPTLANFDAFIQASERIVKREQQMDGKVRIMTVHGAKGLEAPVVMLADTVSVPDLRREQMLATPDTHGRSFPVIQLSTIAKHAPLLEQARTERLEALRAEYHRLLYVALTRARDELHIFGIGEKAPEHSWYATVERAFASLPVTKNADGSIRLRDPAPARKAAKVHEPAVISLPQWATSSPLRRRNIASLAPSRLAETAPTPFARYTPQEAKERGVRIHRVLQLLERDTTETQLAALVAITAPDWSEKTRASAIKEIWTLYQKEHWLWEEEADAEVSISGEIEVHGVLVPVNGQIDRLVRTKGGLIILDYKTGRHVPVTPQAVPLPYLLQLKTYAALLKRMHPNTPVKTSIMWTATPQWMELTALVERTSWLENKSFR